MIGLKNRGSLPAITEDEFEHLVAQFRGLFLAEHNEDGTHITRDRELDFVPVGALQGWLTGTPPTGWVLLDGSQVNRLTYQGLFNLWGTTFGVGDGSTTFNLPDMRGRFFLGKAAAGTGSVLGGTGGAIDHTHGAGSHTHSISSGGSHTHSVATDGSHTHSISSSVSDQKQVAASPHDHITPVGNNDTGDDVASNSHTHGSGNTGSNGNHDHGGSTGSGGSHDHGGATGSASGGTTDSNNPPFLAGNWIAFAGVA